MSLLQREQLTATFVLDVMAQLALGVAHMHSCGILHRDLKSDNALIQALDPVWVKWGDYGCAVQLGTNAYGDGTVVKRRRECARRPSSVELSIGAAVVLS